MPRDWASKNEPVRLFHTKRRSMTEYHKAFLGGAFILPMYTPSGSKGASGFQSINNYRDGRISIAVGLAMNFKLRVISHESLINEFGDELNRTTTYLHNGTKESFLKSMKLALSDFESFCLATMQSEQERVFERGEDGNSNITLSMGTPAQLLSWR
jgi:hypothetical protein